jgi:hypothetical protein
MQRADVILIVEVVLATKIRDEVTPVRCGGDRTGGGEGAPKPLRRLPPQCVRHPLGASRSGCYHCVAMGSDRVLAEPHQNVDIEPVFTR